MITTFFQFLKMFRYKNQFSNKFKQSCWKNQNKITEKYEYTPLIWKVFSRKKINIIVELIDSSLYSKFKIILKLDHLLLIFKTHIIFFQLFDFLFYRNVLKIAYIEPLTNDVIDTYLIQMNVKKENMLLVQTFTII